MRAHSRLWVLGPRLDFVSLQRQWPGLAAQAKVNPARVTELLALLTAPPYRSMMGSTMAAFWASVVLIRFVRRVVVCVGVDENLRSKSIALLEIETTGVAEGLERRRVSPPERRLGRLAVRASLDVGSRRARTLYTAERSRGSTRFCLYGNRGVGVMIYWRR